MGACQRSVSEHVPEETVRPTCTDIGHRISNVMNEKPTFNVGMSKLPDINGVVHFVEMPLMVKQVNISTTSKAGSKCRTGHRGSRCPPDDKPLGGSGERPSLFRTPNFISYRIGDASLPSKGKTKIPQQVMTFPFEEQLGIR